MRRTDCRECASDQGGLAGRRTVLSRRHQFHGRRRSGPLRVHRPRGYCREVLVMLGRRQPPGRIRARVCCPAPNCRRLAPRVKAEERATKGCARIPPGHDGRGAAVLTHTSAGAAPKATPGGRVHAIAARHRGTRELGSREARAELGPGVLSAVTGLSPQRLEPRTPENGRPRRTHAPAGPTYCFTSAGSGACERAERVVLPDAAELADQPEPAFVRPCCGAVRQSRVRLIGNRRLMPCGSGASAELSSQVASNRPTDARFPRGAESLAVETARLPPASA